MFSHLHFGKSNGLRHILHHSFIRNRQCCSINKINRIKKWSLKKHSDSILKETYVITRLQIVGTLGPWNSCLHGWLITWLLSRHLPTDINKQVDLFHSSSPTTMLVPPCYKGVLCWRRQQPTWMGSHLMWIQEMSNMAVRAVWGGLWSWHPWISRSTAYLRVLALLVAMS